MNDPHVEQLFYRVIIPDDIDYNNAPPLTEDTDHFKLHLNKDQLILEFKTHFPTEKEAREIADGFIRNWEVQTDLQNNPDGLSFRFISSEIVDRAPPESIGKRIDLRVSVSTQIMVSDNVTLHVSHSKFPPIPRRFRSSPEVEMMHFRYMLYRKHRESLLGMAYWCATVIKYHFKGYSHASKKLQVSMNVLTKLSFLSSNRGDPKEARKMEGQAGSTPLSSIERMWIEAVIPKLILRVGEHAHDPSAKLPQLTMSDFPAL